MKRTKPALGALLVLPLLLSNGCAALPVQEAGQGEGQAPAAPLAESGDLPGVDELMRISHGYRDTNYKLLHARTVSPIALPMAGMTSTQAQAFNRGRELFTRTWTAKEGLGPVFNANSCAHCHDTGGFGGGGDEANFRMAVTDMTKSDFLTNASGFYEMPELGGPILHAFFNDPVSKIPDEEIPPINRDIFALQQRLAAQGKQIGVDPIEVERYATLVAGDGLLAAIPDALLIQQENRRKPFGITGHANRLSGSLGTIPLTGRIGKLGRKAQLPDNLAFTVDALVTEVGLSNPHLQEDNTVNGPPVAASTPEVSTAEVADMAAFSQTLAPPVFDRLDSSGLAAFKKAGCAECHAYGYTSARTVAEMPVNLRDLFPVLGNKKVVSFTDLLVHNMGIFLADGFPQGSANGAEWRTPPLWGLHLKTAYLHDQRTIDLDEAIQFHKSDGSEASQVVDNYNGVSTLNPDNNLNSRERAALITLLEGL